MRCLFCYVSRLMPSETAALIFLASVVLLAAPWAIGRLIVGGEED